MSGRKPAAILAIGLAIGLALVAVGLRSAPQSPHLLEGKAAPRYALPELQLTPTPTPRRVTIPTPGKATLLHFWGPSCAPCVAQAEVVARLHGEGVRSGRFDVLTISAEDVPDIRAYMRENQHIYPVLYDADGRAHGLYNVNAIPADIIIDRAGKVVRELRGRHDVESLRALLQEASL